MNTDVHVAKLRKEVQEVFAGHLDRHMKQVARNFIQNALECVRDQMADEASGIFRCPSKPAAVDTAVRWAQRWRDVAPYAVQCFLEHLSDSLSFYQLPETWWTRVRTNNPLERTIRTLRIRLRPMNCFANVPAVERAVFGQLARWHLLPEPTQDT